ncbi:MAG TPA: hypothetical protein PLB89_18200 [Flavobacteriales bacterium]|nr:hypothetical protein [Flavobacteriales bacterium]
MTMGATKQYLDERQDLAQISAFERECRVCHCTEMNACVSEDGVPCHWVEEDLCSACDPDDEALDTEPPQVDDRVGCRKCGMPISDVQHDDNGGLCNDCEH